VSASREIEQARRYVAIWAENRSWLEKIRDDEIRQADTAASIRLFDSAFRIALRDLPPPPSSGLDVWQDYMRRWRERLGRG
jgi:hypothetical protein